MKLLLDNKEIDFSFAAEISLQNFLEDFQMQYLTEKKLYIIDYQTMPEKILPQSKVSEIESLSIRSGNQKDLLQENLKELIQYVDSMGIFLVNKLSQNEKLDGGELQSYQEGILWIQEATQNHERYFEVAPAESVEENFLALPEQEAPDYFSKLVALDPNESEDLQSILNLLAEVRDRAAAQHQKLYISLLSAEEKAEMISDFKKHIPQFLQRLEEAAAQISAGKENEAIVSLHEISEQAHSFLSILPQDEAREEKSRALLGLLEEIVLALDAQDSVQAADMIDYDLKEFIQSLATQN